MIKDWNGNKNSIFKTLGASNHTEAPRQLNDYYATEPKAIDILLAEETFTGSIWEPACGEGHLSRRLEQRGHTVISTDLIDRGYGKGSIDFLTCAKSLGDNILTNPPYKHALEFCQHALQLLSDGGKLAMFLKLTFLEGKKRKPFFQRTPPLPYMYHLLACCVLKMVILTLCVRAVAAQLHMGGLFGKRGAMKILL